MISPFSLRILVPTGDPDGLRIVEKSNWTGKGREAWKDEEGRTLKEIQAGTDGRHGT